MLTNPYNLSRRNIKMKTFLASIEKETYKLSIIKQSEEVLSFENDALLILFIGDDFTDVHDIIKVYETKSINFLEDLNHAFSCLLFDKIKNKLFIAKDKVGIQPLYFSYYEDNIIIGTHLKAFNEVSFFQPTINPSSVGEYMQFGSILQPNTIFKNSYKVCAGEYVCFDLNAKRYSTTNYWSLESIYSVKKSREDEKKIFNKVHNLLQKSVENASKSLNFGLSLSGGYDSSTLTAIAQSQSDTKVETFTIGFHDECINEAPHAKKIANHLKTNHHEHYFSANDALELIPKMSEVFDEPFADYASAPTMLTAQLLQKENISNLIAGDGGDEVFATAEDVHLFEKIQKSPMIAKKMLAKPLSALPIEKMPYLKNHNNLAKKINKLQQILQAKSISKMVEVRNTLFLEEELKQQIKEYTQPIETGFDKVHFYGDAQAVDEVIGTYFKTTMADGELIKTYSSMNALSINLETPFFDATLMQEMAKVPASIKIKNDIKKHLLKEIAYQYIPKELIERPKAGFAIPFGAWMKNELKDILYLQINKKRLDKDNIFYTSSILNIRDQFYAGNDAYKYKLWRIFIFQLWYENFQQKIQKTKEL